MYCISNSISVFQGKVFYKTTIRDRYTFIFDLATILAASLVSILILSKAINLSGLNSLAYSFIGIGATFLLADGFAHLFRKRQKMAPDRFSQLPDPILELVVSFLSVKNKKNLKLVNKKACASVTKSEKSDAVQSKAWFRLDLNSIENIGLNSLKLEPGFSHQCYIKLNEKNKIETFILDGKCSSRSSLENTYRIGFIVKKRTKKIFVLLEPSVAYWVEAREFRKVADSKASFLGDWGRDLTKEEDLKLKTLFYETFSCAAGK